MKENRFCFIAPIFNASSTVGQMLASIVAQSYDNWRVIIIDDVSSEEHRRNSANVIDAFDQLVGQERIDFFQNHEKKWETANVLQGISMCEDDDIVCRIDGDDWLTDTDALHIINEVYNQKDCEALWTAHRWGFSNKNISGPMPSEADPYAYPWVSSHFKTFRKRLLNDVKDENFRGPDGEYIKRCGDQAIYLPVLHRTRRRVFLPMCMYHYTIDDVPETYQTDDAKFQRDEAVFLRRRGFIE